MKSKASWLYFVIPIILLGVSIFIMTSGYWWKMTDESNEIIALVNEIEELVLEGKWVDADNKILKTSKVWEKNIRIIQYGVERDRIFEIDETLAKMKGAIKTKDKSSVIQEVHVFYKIWDDLGY
ncbi:DUF4363 family protein [Lottiidibacillus patelloidae]|nr:DUF4363 family protein [Lottiidibacillus patelloidae]